MSEVCSTLIGRMEMHSSLDTNTCQIRHDQNEKPFCAEEKDPGRKTRNRDRQYSGACKRSGPRPSKMA